MARKRTKRERYAARLHGLLDDPPAVAEHLLRNSGLPGPRANLELAWALGDLFQDGLPDPGWWDVLLQWAAAKSPPNTRQEYLPVCALQALGALCGPVNARRRRAIVELLQRAAGDARWRVREGACFALQRLGERDPGALRELLQRWFPRASLVERRAILVTLAHPPLLGDGELVGLALELAGECIEQLAGLDSEAARSEAARVLRKGLEFAPSVYVAADPPRGFRWLRRWAGEESLAVKKVVAANLRKARLARRFPDEVEEVGATLAGDW